MRSSRHFCNECRYVCFYRINWIPYIISALLCPQLLPYEEPTQERLFQKAIPDGSSTKIITSQLQNNLQISQQPFKQTLSQFETGTSNCVQSTNSGKRKRSWSRAVFSNLQRKGLEIQFQIQKYITKPDRRKLAATLNLTDAQVSEFRYLLEFIQIFVLILGQSLVSKSTYEMETCKRKF